MFGLYITREALEGMAARLAATQITDDDIKQLRELIRTHNQTDDALQQRLRDDKFHFTIIQAANSERLRRLLVEDTYYQLRIHRLQHIKRRDIADQRTRVAEVLREHGAIVDALEARDPDRAEAMMRLHIERSRLATFGSLPT